jgi:hypothetical protein
MKSLPVSSINLKKKSCFHICRSHNTYLCGEHAADLAGDALHAAPQRVLHVVAADAVRVPLREQQSGQWRPRTAATTALPASEARTDPHGRLPPSPPASRRLRRRRMTSPSSPERAACACHSSPPRWPRHHVRWRRGLRRVRTRRRTGRAREERRGAPDGGPPATATRRRGQEYLFRLRRLHHPHLHRRSRRVEGAMPRGNRCGEAGEAAGGRGKRGGRTLSGKAAEGRREERGG